MSLLNRVFETINRALQHCSPSHFPDATALFPKLKLCFVFFLVSMAFFDLVPLPVEGIQVNKVYNCFLFRKLSTLLVVSAQKCFLALLSTSFLHALGDKICHSSRRQNISFQWGNEKHFSIGEGMY